MVRNCVQCGKSFEVSEAELALYEEKGLEIPKCCRSCRKSNRIRRNALPIVRGKEKRMQRRKALKAVPATVMMLLIAFSFVLIRVTRGGTGRQSSVSSVEVTAAPPASVQEAVLFRSEELLEEHYEKHGREMGYDSAEEYLAGANAAIYNSTVLHKTEKEDGDDVYYVESTNDLVVVSTDGYIRTYFRPEDGLNYFYRQ